MNQKKYEPKSSKVKTKTRQVTPMSCASKISAQKEVLNKKIDIIYTKMIQSKNSQNYTWKRGFIDLIEKEKGLDIKQSDLLPKSINEVGSLTLRNYKFWFLYLEHMKKNLTFNKLLQLTLYAISFLNKTKEIKMMKILFAAMIKELKVSSFEIEQYCRENRIVPKKKDKYYDYLLFNGFCNADKGEDFMKRTKEDMSSLKEDQKKEEGISIKEQEVPCVEVKKEIEDHKIKEEEKEPILPYCTVNTFDLKIELTSSQKKKLLLTPLIKVIDEKSISENIERFKSSLKEDNELAMKLAATPHKEAKEQKVTPRQNPLIEHKIYIPTQQPLMSNGKEESDENLNISFDQKKYYSFNDLPNDLDEDNPDGNIDDDSDENNLEQQEAENDNNSIEDSYIKYLKEIADIQNAHADPIINSNAKKSMSKEIQSQTESNPLLTPMNKRNSKQPLNALFSQPSNGKTENNNVHYFQFKYNIK